MIGRMRTSPLCLLGALVILMSAGLVVASAQAEKAANAHGPATQQPLYSDYKGVRIGMIADEVRTKLGKPTMAADDQDYYIISQTETVQIAYDDAHRAKAISVDFIDGIGAPDYRTVVGQNIETNPDGSMHKLVNYDSLGFWVSYHRTAGTVPTVSITIHRILKN